MAGPSGGKSPLRGTDRDLLSPRNIPNVISVLRIGLVWPVLTALLARRYPEALGWFVVAGLSDGVDGLLARRFGWISRLGSLLDPLADKILLLTCYIVFGWQGLLPAALVWAVALRDVLIVGGAVLYWFLAHPFEARPLVLSKINTLLQILLIAVVLYSQSIRPLAGPVMDWLVACTFGTTVLSGFLYVWLWGNRYRRAKGLAVDP